MNNKTKYILEQLEGRPKTEITIDLEEDAFKEISAASKVMGVSISEFMELALIEKLIEIETEKYIDDYPNVIDIYDFYKIEEIMETQELYLVINPDGNHVVLMNVDDYNEINRTIEELGE